MLKKKRTDDSWKGSLTVDHNHPRHLPQKPTRMILIDCCSNHPTIRLLLKVKLRKAAPRTLKDPVQYLVGSRHFCVESRVPPSVGAVRPSPTSLSDTSCRKPPIESPLDPCLRPESPLHRHHSCRRKTSVQLDRAPSSISHPLHTINTMDLHSFSQCT